MVVCPNSALMCQERTVEMAKSGSMTTGPTGRLAGGGFQQQGNIRLGRGNFFEYDRSDRHVRGCEANGMNLASKESH
jgi:hypothetical protein